MERNVKIVCCMVAILGILFAATGFSAESTRATSEPLTSTRTCSYSRSPAYGLGITAAVCLIVAQITISVASKCTCCCSKGPHTSHPCWILAVVFFILSWFASIFASLVLLSAAVLNGVFVNDENRTSFNDDYNDYDCPEVGPGVFAGMTILGLISLGLGLAYYIILNSASKALPSSQPGIAMGQPQFPPGEGV